MTAVLAIGVFARPPIAGQGKTRLLPAIGPDGTAKLQRHLIERALSVACGVARARVTLFVAGNPRHPFIASCAQRFGIATRAQAGADLGARMHAAFVDLLAACPRALIVGVDNLTLTDDVLLQAEAALRTADVVVQPADDGGYTLIGLSRPRAELFAGIPWGSPDVLRLTRERSAREHLRLAELPATWDLDTPADLERALRAGLLAESVIR
jgi:rSAM/selenodomain-associated transferase 1